MVQIRFVCFYIFLIFFSSQLYAVTIFKSTDATGSVVFSDKPLPGTHHQEVVELQDFENAASFSSPKALAERSKATAKMNSPASPIAAKEASQIASGQPKKIAPLEEKIMQQLTQARAFYQAVQIHQQKSRGISAADDKYREQLVEAMRIRIARLETQLNEMRQSTTIPVKDAVEFSANNEHSSLPLSQSEIQKLQQFFPDRSDNHSSE